MIEKAQTRFENEPRIAVKSHDFNDSVVAFGKFDAVVSSFAIHHVEDPRKFELYREIFEILTPGGVFINFEHVSSPSEKLHDDFLEATGITRATEEQSNRCAPMSLQLDWLEAIGFTDVDCFWKWRELAVLAGVKPS
jgi:SAM-dependent methyltransferase